MTAALRKMISAMLMAVLLFAQFAVASYACPARAALSPPDAHDAPAVVAMPSHPVHDDAPNVCLEHCRYGQQSADTASLPGIPPAVLTPLYRLSPIFEAAVLVSIDHAAAAAAAVPEPSHSLLHCCLRN